MPHLPPSDQLAYATVRIECDITNGTSTGTGFVFRFCQEGNSYVPAIVTNRHVVQGGTTGRFHMHLAAGPDVLPSNHMRFDVPDFGNQWIGHPDPDVDLCVMPIAPLMQSSKQQGHELFFKSLGEELIPVEPELAELLAIEEIVMVGYPNGIWDHVNNMPVFRRGITATHPNTDYRGKKEFIIDAACFPGSSGSPVLLYNPSGYTDRRGNTILKLRIKLLGVLFALTAYTAEGKIVIKEVPTVAKPVPISPIPNNLGLIIKADRLKEFDGPLRTLSQPTANPPLTETFFA